MEDLENSAKAMYQDEANRTKTPNSMSSDPATKRPRKIQDEDLTMLKSRFPNLSMFSDNFLRSTPLEILLKMESTTMKMSEIDGRKDADDKLSQNKMSLATTFYNVEQGRDNRWTEISEARFLPGAGISATKMWLLARKTIGLKGFPPIGNYDMSSLGLAGVITAKGWTEVHNPSSTKLVLKLFNINSCAAKTKDQNDDDNLFSEIGDFKLALRALKAAVHYVMPWNHSITALEGFFNQNNFCFSDTSNLEKRAQTLTQFTDYVLGQNAERWRDEVAFLTAGELKTAWSTFFDGRSFATKKRDDKRSKLHEKSSFKGSRPIYGRVEGICWNYNEGRCLKAPGNCKTANGKELKHICNFTADKNKPEEVCGKEHMRVKSH